LWISIGLAPVSQVFFPLAATLREHWPYLASIGYFLILARLLDENKQFIFPVGIFLTVFYMGLTFYRNQDWMDPLTLYRHDLVYEPRSFLLHNNIGVVFFKEQKLEEAKKYFENAIYFSPVPGYSVAYNNLGVICLSQGDRVLAERYFIKSIEIDRYANAFANLIKLKLEQNQIDQARQILTQAIQENPYALQLRLIKI
jgi:tetratricopeptide (TPR) repeat protein